MHFGLIGKSIDYSFSKAYFTEKFKQAKLDHSYENCDLEQITQFPALLESKEWTGFNVTIPYKEKILPFVHHLSPEVQSIGAANVIAVRKQKLYAYNTDFLGFRQDLLKFLSAERPEKALILGSGGASKAVIYALQQIGMETQVVGRTATLDKWNYEQASARLADFQLVVNSSPVGTFPHVNDMPALRLSDDLKGKFFYDLIYNPKETRLLKEARLRGAQTRNGQGMLILQAEASWDIWTKP
tara:strand:- start:515 stop:1240 length:726 start_codon:yes stop_codon:yes gene_type:complete